MRGYLSQPYGLPGSLSPPRNAKAKPSLSQQSQEEALPLTGISSDLQTRSQPLNPVQSCRAQHFSAGLRASSALLFSAAWLPPLSSVPGRWTRGSRGNTTRTGQQPTTAQLTHGVRAERTHVTPAVWVSAI